MYQRKSDGLWCEKVGGGKVITAKTQKALISKLKAYNGEKENGVTFFQAVEAWEKYHTEKVSYKAAEVYKPCIKRAKDYFGDVYIKDIAPNDVNAFIMFIASQDYAQRTVSVHLNMMRQVFNYAIIQPHSVVKTNPCASVSIPKGLPKTRRLPPTDAELSKVKPDCEMGLFATFLLYSGLRRGELLALQWQDIDFEKKLIHVTKSVTYTSNQPSIKSTKTEAGVRDVDLLDILIQALPDPGRKTDYIFGGEKPLTKSSYFKRWRSYTKSIGIEATAHQFRHAYASMLDDAGIDETTEMQLLGHSSITVTKDVYTHLRKAKRERAANQLNQYISGTSKSESH